MTTRIRRELRLLRAYAVISGLLLTVLTVAAFRRAPAEAPSATFTEIDAQRINIRDANGRLRMVISNTDRFPPPVISGHTYKRQGAASPGILFYNEEGDEDGGLSFNGGVHNGRTIASGSLMFDQFRQDQTVGIEYAEEGAVRSAGLHVWDRPDTPIVQLMDRILAARRIPDQAKRTAALGALRSEGLLGAERVFVGKQPDKSAVVALKDGLGRPRLVLEVEPSGAASIEFLDADGKVVDRYPTKKP
jgi:hypothetical protein